MISFGCIVRPGRAEVVQDKNTRTASSSERQAAADRLLMDDPTYRREPDPTRHLCRDLAEPGPRGDWCERCDPHPIRPCAVAERLDCALESVPPAEDVCDAVARPYEEWRTVKPPRDQTGHHPEQCQTDEHCFPPEFRAGTHVVRCCIGVVLD